MTTETQKPEAKDYILAHMLRENRYIEDFQDFDWPEEITPENASELWDRFWGLYSNYSKQDQLEEFRESGEETDLPCEWSRYYESYHVGRQLDDGTWVGWTYWYGGGKHAYPEEMPWLEDAVFLDVKEEEKMVVVKTFSVRE